LPFSLLEAVLYNLRNTKQRKKNLVRKRKLPRKHLKLRKSISILKRKLKEQLAMMMKLTINCIQSFQEGSALTFKVERKVESEVVDLLSINARKLWTAKIGL